MLEREALCGRSTASALSARLLTDLAIPGEGEVGERGGRDVAYFASFSRGVPATIR